MSSVQDLLISDRNVPDAVINIPEGDLSGRKVNKISLLPHKCLKLFFTKTDHMTKIATAVAIFASVALLIAAPLILNIAAVIPILFVVKKVYFDQIQWQGKQICDNNNALQQRFDLANTKVDVQERSLQQLTKQNGFLEERRQKIEATHGDITTLLVQHKKATAKLATLLEQISKREEAYKDLLSRHEVLMKAHAEVSKQCKSFTDKLAKTSKQNTAALADLKKTKDEIATLTARSNKVQKSTLEIIAKHKSAMEKKEATEKEVSKCTEELEKVQKDFADTTQKLAELHAEYKKTLVKYDQTAVKMKEQLAELERENLKKDVLLKKMQGAQKKLGNLEVLKENLASSKKKATFFKELLSKAAAELPIASKMSIAINRALEQERLSEKLMVDTYFDVEVVNNKK